ncbi:metallophosphoesterase [Iamia sp. SCSIO 61187]|uniref:metallophosphoesterase family protein n=1 Tax=Iamia sp. SCSIO 61187 TaxID=2722752 RepID=UPI001C625042|nr:metallophosphoesterase [Iamia sp. SCSIO 61187]QYG93186.1 metallophosphoesterase [Iamia sp. SCSIO 61187]
MATPPAGPTRRQVLAAGLGAAGAVATGGALREAWALLGREDLIPGEPPTLRLEPEDWVTTDDRLSFAAIGDSGSGGRQAMAVAERMARTYAVEPFGLVALLGDICYYGSIEDRFEDVFVRPMAPLIDAGVEFQLAVGNHDGGLHYGDESLREIEATLDRLGTPARYHSATRGPVDLFFLDSSEPGIAEGGTHTQLEWLDDMLASATSRWKVVALHHPLYSSGRHGSTERLQDLVEPILVRHHVDLVLAGHDHHYERTVPIDGITHVVSGGGCKTTGVRPRRFTAAAASTLEFVKLDIVEDRLVGRAIRPEGDVIDRFELRAREGR